MNYRKSNRYTTLDTYRNNLERAGFLKSVDRGMYKRVKKIPTDLTISKCLEIAKLKEKTLVEERKRELEEKENELKTEIFDNNYKNIKRLEIINQNN